MLVRFLEVLTRDFLLPWHLGFNICGFFSELGLSVLFPEGQSLPRSHGWPSTNVFTEKTAEGPHSLFFHLHKEAEVTLLPS